MPGRGKKYREARSKIDPDTRYSFEQGIEKILEGGHFAKFDESVDIAVRLGINPKYADQMVRGALVLPHGTGKTKRVLVFAKGEKEAEARDAGADFVGGDDLVEKIKEGWMEFDDCIATPDMMGTVGKIGKLLGPRGLMPNPKVGTVTFDVERAVREAKAGRIEYRVDKAGIIHAPVGRVSFNKDKLKENILELMDALLKAKPSSAKGTYVRTVTISSTMGPGVRLDVADLISTIR